MQIQTQEQLLYISDALAIAVETMEDNPIGEPTVAGRIQTVRTAVKGLQLILERLN